MPYPAPRGSCDQADPALRPRWFSARRHLVALQAEGARARDDHLWCAGRDGHRGGGAVGGVAGPFVAVLDYGSGNLRSAERALQRAGARVLVTPSVKAAADADGLVVPGVGAYAACMAGIDAISAGPMIAARVEAGRAVLGICVGMQVMFDFGVEHGVRTPGLGLLPGGVTRLAAPRVPHMGWNTVTSDGGFTEFEGLSGERFYF